MMGGLKLHCPVCCSKSFDSKQSLLEHLLNVVDKLYCPICNSKHSSLDGIIEHLNQADCYIVPEKSTENIVLFKQTNDIAEHSTDFKNIERLSDELSSEFITDQALECQDENGDIAKMYELMLKPHELKLIKEDGESRYVIVNPEEDLGTIVTKQNIDGTVSLTSRDTHVKEETLMVTESDFSNSQEEVYTCNACKISFTSVYEHIQIYHNDQDVVLEDIAPEIETEDNQIAVNSDGQESEECSSIDKLTARRVITETGDIVEEPMGLKIENAEIQHVIDEIDKQSELVLAKHDHGGKKKKVMQINHAEVSIVKNLNKDENKKIDPYHKVIRKEMQSETGDTITLFHCLVCNINVSNISDFGSHPCKLYKFPCPHCPAAYETSKSLRLHMKSHKAEAQNTDASTDTPITYECGVCSTVFLTNKSLKLHKRMHDPVKARPIEPPVENNDGNDLAGTLYQCNICDKMIPFDYRKIHADSHISGDEMNCNKCNKKFASLEYLEMHMNVHNLDKVTVNNPDKTLPYECLYCNRRFARPHEKVKHERIHTGEKPHACEICGKSFRVSYCLTLHMRTHTGARPYACAHCGKRFKAHSVYNHHLLTHSEVRAYKCPFCPKAFKTAVQLAGHKNSHTKPFSCQQCNRPFASLYAVRIHTETHSRQNNLKFSCSLCGASYARAFALKDHIKQVHKQEVDDDENTNENKEDIDWLVKGSSTITEGMAILNQELHDDMSDLEMNANELIVP